MKIDKYWKLRNYSKRVWWRLKNCFKLLFTGYAEFEGHWGVENPKELKNLIDYLTNCYNQMVIKRI